jgi:hypothetical protein
MMIQSEMEHYLHTAFAHKTTYENKCYKHEKQLFDDDAVKNE